MIIYNSGIFEWLLGEYTANNVCVIPRALIDWRGKSGTAWKKWVAKSRLCVCSVGSRSVRVDAGRVESVQVNVELTCVFLASRSRFRTF